MLNDISKVVLVCDMDGTLLDSEKRISEEDSAAIEKFMDLGGRFTISTGRTIQSFRQYYDMLDLRIPVMMYNGAAIYDWEKEKYLYCRPLPASARDIATEILSEMPQIGGEVLTTKETYVFRNNEYQMRHTKICGITPCYMDLEKIPDSGSWMKVLFSMAPEDIDKIEKLTAQRDYSGVSFVKSADILYEMMPDGITKGSALDEYRKLDGMDDCVFVAAGDYNNDIEMLISADIGAAPSNAEDEVKRSADIVLSRSNDESAIAELIDIILKECEDKP